MNRFFVMLVAVSLSAAALASPQELPKTQKADQQPTPTTSPKKDGKAPLMVSFTELKWVELPERKGMQFSVLSGDPKTGAYTQMRKVPAGTDNGLHAHSSELKNVIISGVWYTGADAASARDFGPGSVVMMPADWMHVSGCRPGTDCVFYQEGKGKFDFKPVLKSLGVTTKFSDSAQGSLGWISVTTYDSFTNVLAIRAHANWEVSALARNRRGHKLNLSISIDEESNTGQLALGLAVWEFPLGGTDIKVINSASTGELLIRFEKSMPSTRHREPVTMSKGSYIAIQDAQ